MTKESTYELQKIDCNCNDCKHLLRDVSKYKLWNLFHRDLQHKEYMTAKNDLFFIGFTFRDKAVLDKAYKLRFMPKNSLINYGFCKKFNLKEISFIPNTLQIETQECFEHRK